MPAPGAQQLERELSAGRLRPFYYLAGEEIYRRDQAVKKIRALVNPDDFNYYSAQADKADMGEVVSLAATAPVFSARRLIILSRADKLKAEPRRLLSDYLSNPLETTCLVLTSDERKAGKDDQIAKICEGAGARFLFYGLRADEAEQWVIERAAEAGSRISREAAGLLVDCAGTDLNALERETSKLLIYTAGSKTAIGPEAVLESLGFSKEENPFELSAALLRRDSARALLLTDKLLADGQEPVFLLSLISSNLMKILKVRRMSAAGTPKQQIFAEARLNAYYDSDFIRAAENFGDDKTLLSAIDKALDAEAALKSSSAEAGALLKSLILKALPQKR